MKKKITLLDIIITALLFLFITAFIIFNFITNDEQNKILIIESPDGKFYYNLNQKKIVSIKGNLGITNIEIDNGRFRFERSPCINKLCINVGWININNYPIICLPNKVTAYIRNLKNDDNFDGISR